MGETSERSAGLTPMRGERRKKDGAGRALTKCQLEVHLDQASWES